MSSRAPNLTREIIQDLAGRGYAADVEFNGPRVKVRWIQDGRQHLITFPRKPRGYNAVVALATLRRSLAGR
jgi:hypothetical protein